MILQAPLFLFGLLAIAVPVIIHLVQLRKPQRVLFTNVAFIRNIENITSNQRKLKHWLILLARILFIAFLVFVFCEPFLPASDASISDARQVAVYLDNSGSMQNESEKGGLNLFEQAKDEVQLISNAFPKQTKFSLIDNSFSLTSSRNINGETLPNNLAGLDFSPISRQTSIIIDRLAANKTGNTKVYWFSDFQRATFDPGFFNRTDTVSEINLIKLTPASTANLFIDSVALEDELVRVNQNNRLLVKIFN